MVVYCECCGNLIPEDIAYCEGCKMYLCDACGEECECCGDVFCPECLELHEEGLPIENKDKHRCPDCRSTNITYGKQLPQWDHMKNYYSNWYYCENCGLHYRPASSDTHE